MAQYHIKFFNRERLIEDRTCIDEPREAVERQAKVAVELGTADRTEVRDVQGPCSTIGPRRYGKTESTRG